MPRQLPPLNPLRAFEAAGRLGSFTKAAEELNVYHSAISRHVRGLEARLDVPLFRTRNTGVELTDPGRTYLAEITPAFDRIALATEALSQPAAGVVTLTTESTVAQKWLVPRLGRLRAAHPGIDLRLSLSTEVMDIAAHDYDLGLRFLRAAPPEGTELLFPCEVSAYAAPGFAPRKDGALDLETLAQGPLIQEATWQFWPDWFRLAGLGKVPDLALPHPLSALLSIQSAIAGLGPVLMDRHLCEIEVETGALERLSDAQLVFGGYYLTVNPRAARRKAVRAVRDWMIAESA